MILATPFRITAAAFIAHWAAEYIAAGHELYIPDVIDYELRRELLRAKKASSILLLHGLKASLNFLPIHSPTILLAADLWNDIVP